MRPPRAVDGLRGSKALKICCDHKVILAGKSRQRIVSRLERVVTRLLELPKLVPQQQEFGVEVVQRRQVIASLALLTKPICTTVTRRSMRSRWARSASVVIDTN